MVRLPLVDPHTRLASDLCSACPHSPFGCCIAPPPFDWSDVGRVVALGGRDWLLEQIAKKHLTIGARGLHIQRKRARASREERKEQKCVFHGPDGCTIDPAKRPATCNYYLCEEAFADVRKARGDAEGEAVRRTYDALLATYSRWDQHLGERVAERLTEGVQVTGELLDWLGEAFGRLAREQAGPRGA